MVPNDVFSKLLNVEGDDIIHLVGNPGDHRASFKKRGGKSGLSLILFTAGDYKIAIPSYVEGHPSTPLRMLDFATPSVGKIGKRSG